VDLAYLQPLQLVDLDLERRRETDGPGAELVNPAAVLFGRGGKLLACTPQLSPPTVAATGWDLLSSFGRAERRVIAKPLHQAQSKGVALLDFDGEDACARSRVALHALTDGFTRPALLQRYLPGVLGGETRLWLVDGELIACVRKRAAAGSYKIDMDKGGTLAPHTLDALERERAPLVCALLRRHGIRLAAVDLIDGLVTDCNFTSPGLLPLMEQLLETNLARVVVERLVQPAPSVRRAGATL
jgi:glutathione synthase